jgi:hypothetical protein
MFKSKVSSAFARAAVSASTLEGGAIVPARFVVELV